jgi:hypothetical protein
MFMRVRSAAFLEGFLTSVETNHLYAKDSWFAQFLNSHCDLPKIFRTRPHQAREWI